MRRRALWLAIALQVGCYDLRQLSRDFDAGTDLAAPDGDATDAASPAPDAGADLAAPGRDVTDAASPVLDAASGDLGGQPADGAPPDLARTDGPLPDLARTDGPPPDLAQTADLSGLPASCSNMMKDGTETDVDCGGTPCDPCAADRACLANGDCTSGLCVDKRCQRASGPPNWTWIAAPPQNLNYQAVAALDGLIYAIGGVDTVSQTQTAVFAYTIATNTWTTEPQSLIHNRSKAAAAAMTGKLYVLGGSSTSLSVGKDVERRETDWVDLAPLTTSRAGPSAVTLNDTLYAVGGDSTLTLEVYSELTNTWTQRGGPPIGRAEAAAAAGADGLLYAIGGRITSALTPVDAWSPGMQAWISKAPLPAGRSLLAVGTGADGRTYAAGGFDGVGYPTTVVAYTPATNHWDTVAMLKSPRYGSQLARGRDGRLYAVGGGSAEAYGPILTVLASAEQLLVSGQNFAAGARVRIYQGPAGSGTLLATTTSGSTGTFGSVTVVPLGLPPYQISAVDDRSEYPVSFFTN